MMIHHQITTIITSSHHQINTLKVMKYYLIAGEASGDLHGSNLMKELKEKDKQAVFRFWGGDLMQEQGGELIKHYRDTAYMGVWEVAKNLRQIFKNIAFCKKDIVSFQPDALILIDYPGFNLRIAKFAKQLNIRVIYYISPKIWAWKESRIKRVKAGVDHMLSILPFEIEFYKKHNFPIEYVGNPILDAIKNYQEKNTGDSFLQENNLGDKPIVAILPGSRKQEIENMLPVMLSIVGYYPDYQFVIAGTKTLGESLYQSYILDKSVKILYNRTYDILSHARAALVTSGTATLETALFDVPEVCCMRANWITYVLVKQVIKVDYLSLVNLILERPAITELIQAELNTKQLRAELDSLLEGEKREKMLVDFQYLKKLLGEGGASKAAAEYISKVMDK